MKLFRSKYINLFFCLCLLTTLATGQTTQTLNQPGQASIFRGRLYIGEVFYPPRLIFNSPTSKGALASDTINGQLKFWNGTTWVAVGSGVVTIPSNISAFINDVPYTTKIQNDLLYAPLSHFHAITDVTGLLDALNAKQGFLGFDPVPDTRTVNGHTLDADVTVTKDDVGLPLADNTSDANKPISSATQAALNVKPDYVTDIAALQAYAGTATTVIVKDAAQGGTFHLKLSGFTVDGGIVFAATGQGGGTKVWVRQYSGALHSKWYGMGDGSNCIAAMTNMFSHVVPNMTIIIDSGLYIFDTLFIATNKGNLTIYAYGATIKMADHAKTYQAIKILQNGGNANIGSLQWFGGTFDGNRTMQGYPLRSIDPSNVLGVADEVWHNIGNSGILTLQGYYSATVQDVTVTKNVSEGIVMFTCNNAIFKNCIGTNGLPISQNNVKNILNGDNQQTYFKVRSEIGTHAKWEHIYTEGGSIGVHYSSNHAGVGSSAEFDDITIVNPMQDAVHIEHCETVNIHNLYNSGDLVGDTVLYRPEIHVGGEYKHFLLDGWITKNSSVSFGVSATSPDGLITNFNIISEYNGFGIIIDNPVKVTNGSITGKFSTAINSAIEVRNVSIHSTAFDGTNYVGTGIAGASRVIECTFDSLATAVTSLALDGFAYKDKITDCNKAIVYSVGSSNTIKNAVVKECTFENINKNAVIAPEQVKNLDFNHNTCKNIGLTQAADNENAIISSSNADGLGANYTTVKDNIFQKDSANATINIAYSNDTALKGFYADNNQFIGATFRARLTHSAAKEYRNVKSIGYNNWQAPIINDDWMGQRRYSLGTWVDFNGVPRFKTGFTSAMGDNQGTQSVPASDTDGVTYTDVVSSGSSAPILGAYRYGAIVKNTSLSGTNWGWIQTTPGDYIVVSRWATSTNYIVRKITANGDNVYRATQQGTSAASGTGPTGSGTGIADGTQIWDRIGTLASYSCDTAWASSTAYIVNAIRYNGTDVYQVVTAGTSASSGGPSGTTQGISDGSVIWNFLGHRSVWKTFGLIGTASAAFGYTPLNPANNLSDLASFTTARTNLGFATITNYVDKTVANTYTAGATQIFTADVTNAGFGLGGVTANPSSIPAGRMWFRSDENKIHYSDGTTDRKIVAEALAQPLTNKTIDASQNTITNIGNSSLTNSTITFNGTSTALGGSIDTRPVSAKVTGSDVTTTLATAVDVTGLSVAVSANKKYRIMASLNIGCNNTGGVKLAINGPAGASLNGGAWIGDNTSANAVKGGKAGTLGTLGTTLNLFNSNAGWVTYMGYINISSTAGNVVIQVASATAGETSTVFTGSTMDLTEVQSFNLIQIIILIGISFSIYKKREEFKQAA